MPVRFAPPPFSPVLLAGMVLPPSSGWLAERALTLAVRRVWRRHPVIADRLRPLGAVVYRIDPLDLPYSVVLSLGGVTPSARVIDRDAAPQVTATIRGGLADLMALLSGRADGDALFFSRALTVEGNTDAVVALRNAVDDAEVDLRADILADMGPFAGVGRWAFAKAEGVARVGGDATARIADALRAPVARRVDAHGHLLAELEGRLDGLERTARRKRRE